jgi:hypothetical protein
MTIRQCVSMALAVALITGAMPVMAAGPDQVKDPQSASLRSAVDRAATRAVAEHQLTSAPGRPAPQNGARLQSSGGGHTGMIISLVGVIAGAAGTYYMVKQLKKTTDQVNQQVAGQNFR